MMPPRESINMTPFLIRTRTGAPARSIVIWAVISESEIDARSAVAGVVAAGWTVEDVIGTATPAIVKLLNLEPGKPERLA
jgi:hypothetical protein